MGADPGQGGLGVLKHYQLVREIGRGGMGVVYDALDRRDGTRVAVKVLREYLLELDPSFTERFEREAHVAALLRSPYTVHVLDFGADQGRYFMAMEFIEGQSLSQLLAQGPLAPDRALEIAVEVARALEEAQARGVVHRDLKPDNILLDSSGRAKVADFGIARQRHSVGLTMPGAFTGTPDYAAPEQILGSADSRTDIYAFGATLYHMLAGRPPFQGASAQAVLDQHRFAPLPMQPLAHLPDAVQNIVRRCLEKDPEDRYQSASELAGALERGRRVLSQAANRPTPAPPPVNERAPAPPRSETVATHPEATRVAQTPPVASVQTTPPPGATPPVGVAPPAGATRVAATDSTRVAGPADPSPPTPAPVYMPPAAAPAPPTAAATGSKGGRRAMVIGIAAGVAVLAGAGGAFALLGSGGGNDNKSATTASPTVAATDTAQPSPSPTPSPTVSATPTQTATPTATRTATTPALPSVTPPAGTGSALQSGAKARTVNAGTTVCTVRLWALPSEATTGDYAVNKVLRTMCNNDSVIVVTNTPPDSTIKVTEGYVWWRVLYEKTNEVGWVKEIRSDGTGLRSLALVGRTTTLKAGDTCGGVAETNGVTVDQFLAWNPEINAGCTNIQVGQTVRIGPPP